jgi:hypothetical protein
MPVLFAYLIALGLLLGGGYGALSWLAAPEPLKVVAKAKPKPHPRYEASAEVASAETSPLNASDSDHATSGSNNQPSPAQASPIAAGAQGTSELANDRQIRAAHAEVTSGDAKRPIEAAPVQAKQEVKRSASPVSPPSNPQAAAAPTAAAKPAGRSHARQASNHSEKPSERRGLVLMTLRTIEFPDGRRVTRLIPYREADRVPYRQAARALAFDADD